MSDDTTAAPAETTETPETTVEPPAQETDWKAEARKWEARAKENSTAAKRLAEIEEANKSEAQKLADRAEKAERELAEARANAARLSVIAKHSIPEEYHEFIVGDSEEALEAKAEKVKKLIAAQESPQSKHVTIPGEGKTPAMPLNGDGLEAALKNVLGIH